MRFKSNGDLTKDQTVAMRELMQMLVRAEDFELSPGVMDAIQNFRDSVSTRAVLDTKRQRTASLYNRPSFESTLSNDERETLRNLHLQGLGYKSASNITGHSATALHSLWRSWGPN